MTPTVEFNFVDSHRGMATKEAARFLGFAPKTLAQWRCQGKGPVYSKSDGRRGAVRYSLNDLMSFRANSMRRSTSDQGQSS